MTIEHRLGGALLTNRVELVEGAPGFVTAAERGAVGSSGVVIDDPNGDLTITGWNTYTVDDTAATPTRVWTGYIAERNLGRGGKFFTGVGRVHDCMLVDQNTLLHMAIFRANAAKRPAETDVARVAYALASEALAGVVTDEGLVATSPTYGFLAADLRRTYPDDMLRALSAVTGRNFFVYRDTTSGNAALFHDADTSAVYDATIAISNVASDVDNSTTFAPLVDANLNRSPDEVYTGVSYGWRGDPIFASSAATATAYGINRDAVLDTDRIGLLTTAQAEATRFLDTHAAEKDFITVTLILPSAAVNKAFAGQRISVRFSHLPGYETAVYTRIRRRTARPIGPDRWEVTYELWVPPTLAGDAAVVMGTCSYTPNSAPSTNSSDDIWGDFVNPSGVFVTGSPPSVTVTSSGGVSPNGTFNVAPNFGADAGVFGDSTFEIRWAVDLGSAMTICTAQLIGSYPSPVSLFPFALEYSDEGSSWSVAIASLDGTAQAVGNLSHRYWSLHYGPHSVGAGYYPGFTLDGLLLWDGTIENPAPQVGQWVTESLGFGDGSTTNFATGSGFETATFLVFVDNVDQTAGTTITDNIAGTFTLGFAPGPSEQVTAKYQSL